MVCLLVLSSKYRQSPTWDHFIANIFMFSKMALLTLCFILDKRLCVYYTILVICMLLLPKKCIYIKYDVYFLVLFVLVKQPEHRIQDKTVLFSPEELHGTLGTNPHQVYYCLCFIYPPGLFISCYIKFVYIYIYTFRCGWYISIRFGRVIAPLFRLFFRIFPMNLALSA